MKNYKITIQYDGTRYSGWQVQKCTEDTIQGKIEHVLSTLVNHPVEIMGSGRTDAGVHAIGQVANFHIEDEYDKDQVFLWLNSHLPKDIAITEIEEVPERFHSRFSATRKTYVYRIHTGAVSNVFERKYVYDYGPQLDVERMRQAAKLLEGEHDFKSFCGNKRMKKSTVRTIYSIDIEELSDEIRISYTGKGFLMNMVRILTGTLIEVGDGRRTPESMTEILEKKDREQAGYTAPPQGLVLKKVYYGTMDRL